MKDAADVVRLLMAAVREPGEAAVVIPIQVTVVGGEQVVPNLPPDEE